MRLKLILVVLVGFSVFAGELPSFDVASIRPGSHPVTKEGYSISNVGRSDPKRFRAVNCDLSELIGSAYGVRNDRISGPAELHSHETTFDIDATMPAEATDAQVKLMLQRLLAERFGVVLRFVTKPTSGYLLVVDSGGPKLKPSELPNYKGIMAYGGSSSVRMISPAVRMGSLASSISKNIEVPVEDQTHLTRLYDIDFTFSRIGPVDSDAPTVFEAVRKLGLRLDKGQIPIETIVVDRVNFKPSEN